LNQEPPAHHEGWMVGVHFPLGSTSLPNYDDYLS
jgi:hypothetical protein